MEDKQTSPPPGEPRKNQVREQVSAGAALTPTYVVMNLLATLIACYGLLEDSTAGVIGAMVIAMLLGPITGVGLALADNDLPLLRKSVVAELAGAAIVMGTAFLVGLLQRDTPVGQEILARTNPGTADLVIALAGGAAATVAAVTGGVSLSLVGVAIATALVPPLSTCSMLLARGESRLALGAFLLAFTNMVAIQFASSVVFWIAGYSNTTRFWSAGYRVLVRNAVSLLLLVLLAGILAISTHHGISNHLFETAVRKTLRESLKKYDGASLSEVRFDRWGEKPLVRAVVRSPHPLSQDDVAALERHLPRAPGGSEVILRVRRVSVEVMTRNGPLFESEEASQPAKGP
jgi:uncharacterized hydrophobic protein (TIGR00271 family)